MENIQSLLLEQIRKKLAKHVSLQDELAEVLGISIDSSYRRVRGATAMSLEEASLLCNRFDISLDELLALKNNSVTFKFRNITSSDFTLIGWLENIRVNLETISKFNHKEIIYCSKDFPIFYYYQIPELAAFKNYFWMKVYLRYHDYENIKFDFSTLSSEIIQIENRIWDLYKVVPSKEIWSFDMANITIHQIEYSYACGFISRDQAISLLNHLSQLLSNTRDFALEGSKNNSHRNFVLYHNDILSSDTAILVKADDKLIAYQSSLINILSTHQVDYCTTLEQILNNSMSRSNLISQTGERERNKFFNILSRKVTHSLNEIN